MHFDIVVYILGKILRIEAYLMLLPALTGVIYRELECVSFFLVAAATYIVGTLMTQRKPEKFVLYSREGLVTVSLSWILISLIGCLPFVVNGDIPSFTNALFETISGFTTTGASILENVEALSHASLMWRSFTHWVGGMGVIVFMLAILPMTGGHNMQLMRAESPGPSVGKLVPKVRESAKILYLIYFAMTVVEIIVLICARMPVFDALCISFGSAGTGGFGVKADSCGSYTSLQQSFITLFITLFGVNFNAYYFLLGKNRKEAFKMEEVRWYLAIIAASVALITVNVRGYFDTLYQAFHHAFFQVSSIITTTGYGTTDFDLWPEFSKMILVFLMFVGACAGSTGGGIKVSRIIILIKSVGHELIHYIHPKSVTTMKFDGRPADKEMVKGVSVYLAAYCAIYIVSMLLLSLDNRQDFTTNFTAVAATFNNIGPGLSKVGPVMNYNGLAGGSKYVLMFDMLAGRLELYPMLMLFVPAVWKRR